jgi:hypothetical protein
MQSHRETLPFERGNGQRLGEADWVHRVPLHLAGTRGFRPLIPRLDRGSQHAVNSECNDPRCA